MIPVRNDAHGLRRCLDSISLNRRRSRAIEVIVVDNGSADESVTVARERGARVVERPGVSVAALRNLGAALARGETLAFVDADHEIAEDWADRVLDVLADPSVAATGAPYVAPVQANWVQQAYDHLRDHRPGQRDVRWLGSGNLVVRRAAFERIGGFDASLATCEDVDFCARLLRGGQRIVSDSRIVNVHHGDPHSLADLFAGELWRGQDNLRVSFRGQLRLADGPAIAIPLILLLSFAAVLVAVVTWPSPGDRLALLGVLGILAVVALRVGRMRLRGAAVSLSRLTAVAATFETARALALMVRVRHRRAHAAQKSAA